MGTVFDVLGPREIPFYQGKAGRTITDENVKEFWRSHQAYSTRRGCYIFGVRAGKGFTPGYVGAATKSFKQEVFSSHKLARYQQFLVDYVKGTPVIFLIMAPLKKGKPNTKHVKELEQFLIQRGVAANPELLNVKGTQAAEWGIKGIIRSGKGKPSKATIDFKRYMKL